VDRNAMPLVPEDRPAKPQETKQESKFKVNPDATP